MYSDDVDNHMEKKINTNTLLFYKILNGFPSAYLE